MILLLFFPSAYPAFLNLWSKYNLSIQSTLWYIALIPSLTVLAKCRWIGLHWSFYYLETSYSLPRFLTVPLFLFCFAYFITYHIMIPRHVLVLYNWMNFIFQWSYSYLYKLKRTRKEITKIRKILLNQLQSMLRIKSRNLLGSVS